MSSPAISSASGALRRVALATCVLLMAACAGGAPEPAASPEPEPVAAEPEAPEAVPEDTEDAEEVAEAEADSVAETDADEVVEIEIEEVEVEEEEVVAEEREESWTGPGPAPLPGAVLPERRIVAYYGNPLSKRMGILGEVPPEQMLARLDQEVEKWNEADPNVPAVPALHLIAVVAHADPGWDGKYRGRVSDEVVERVAGWAEEHGALLFLDIQPALSTVQEELPRLAKFLSRPDVHLGLDPEFSMKQGNRPGTRIGTMNADDINFAIDFLADLVQEHDLPPKVLVVHRFTRNMITNTDDIRLRPEVQLVIHMDGWGPPALKRQTYNAFVGGDPVQFTGFKLFYHNDTKAGDPLMTPEQILQLDPDPVYIQYH